MDLKRRTFAIVEGSREVTHGNGTVTRIAVYTVSDAETNTLIQDSYGIADALLACHYAAAGAEYTIRFRYA